MPFKSTLNYSPNFNSKKRPKKQIRFIVLHYTGMKSENAAINKLTNIQSQVASHYLITRNGKIINLVPDLYIAWHAGISSWHNFLERTLSRRTLLLCFSRHELHASRTLNFFNFVEPNSGPDWFFLEPSLLPQSNSSGLACRIYNQSLSYCVKSCHH